ncbi:phosphatidylethanolamine-binding protein [Mycotypha africana]|uniref:phosphatidylethanolamine-binding protein n=1 Tax=Mycotypha africana TaxID=64632 RepID=UPI0023007D6E|nr:phosphatidylethanolamine-binding protein [Mycotypha africana]KAI8984196.1 phosphatidylethanolamine-binding protein [Mycotypha africana]
MVLVTMDMNMSNALKKADIIPNIVSNDFTPSTLLGIKFPNGEEVALGNFIKPSDSQEAPEVTFVAPDENAKYTLLMIDPDAPSKEDPKWAPYRHWVLTNVPGNGDIKQASALDSYLGPAPPPNTGDHRYIFLLYKQPETAANYALTKEANKWDFQAFTQQNNLELIGVNYFISRNDEN